MSSRSQAEMKEKLGSGAEGSKLRVTFTNLIQFSENSLFQKSILLLSFSDTGRKGSKRCLFVIQWMNGLCLVSVCAQNRSNQCEPFLFVGFQYVQEESIMFLKVVKYKQRPLRKPVCVFCCIVKYSLDLKEIGNIICLHGNFPPCNKFKHSILSFWTVYSGLLIFMGMRWQYFWEAVHSCSPVMAPMWALSVERG